MSDVNQIDADYNVIFPFVRADPAAVMALIEMREMIYKLAVLLEQREGLIERLKSYQLSEAEHVPDAFMTSVREYKKGVLTVIDGGKKD